jgi:deoxyribose-phosphate aldolase
MKKLETYLEHTLLKPEATKADIHKLCKEASQYNFRSVCVNAYYVPWAVECLQGKKPVVAVVGFPLGATFDVVKAFEAKEAVMKGASEIDMVINIGALKSKDYKTVLQDIFQVVDIIKPVPVKVILENCFLDYDEKVMGCTLAKEAGASYVKTSTGFGKGGATLEDVALMRRIVGPELGVKASGGIRTKEDAWKMIEAGASCLGTSASVSMVI